jgi:flagellar biosynthesis/type III secretory pathway chaperone
MVNPLHKDNRDILNRLLSTIEEVDQNYHSLLKALEREKASLAAVNLADFMVANEQKELELESLQQLETRRAQETKRLGDALGITTGEITLSRLAKHLEADDADRLLASGEKLSETLSRIRRINRVNRRLIRGSLGFVSDSLQMLQNLKRPSSTYHSNGQMTHGACRGTILAGEI